MNSKNTLLSLLRKVDEMKTQRLELMRQFRKNISTDEITKKLIKSDSQDYEVLQILNFKSISFNIM
jgi:hypothetical protein